MTFVVWVQVPPPVPDAMKIKQIKHKDELTIEWDITLPAKSVDEVLENKYHDLKKVNLPGFRPGKVPVNIIKKRQ